MASISTFISVFRCRGQIPGLKNRAIKAEIIMKPKQSLSVAFALAFPIASSAKAAVTLLDSVNVGITSGTSTSNVITNTTGIDLNDGANFLAVVIAGEFNADSVSFGGQAMTQSAFRSQGTSPTITQAHIFTLFNPNLASSQTLSVQADFQSTNFGYTLQYYSFNNVDSIGAVPNGGGTSGATVNLDFGSVTAGSYLLMAGADNNGGIAFAGASPLVTTTGSGSGWREETAGVSVLEDSGSAICSATSTARHAVAGIELIAAIPEPSAAVLGGLGFLLLLRRRR